MSSPSTHMKRREFVTRTAALLISGAVLPGCDEEAALDPCASESGVDDPECPDDDDAVEAPELVAEPELDDFRALRCYE